MDPVDDLITQIDQNDTVPVCNKCLYATPDLVKTSCNHFLCLSCMEKAIETGEYKKCLICNIDLTKNIHKLFTDYLVNPMNKLSYYHDIHTGEMVWYYEGKGHNWLYSKEHCRELEDAYQLYEDSDDGENETCEIEIPIGSGTEVYVINFSSLTQYPKNDPSKKRKISCFALNSISDLRHNKIIGIGGKLL